MSKHTTFSGGEEEAERLRNEGSDQERTQFLRRAHWVDYPRVERLTEKVEKLSGEPRGRSEKPPALLVTGPSGNGKTMLAQRLMWKMRPEEETDSSQDEVPVAYAVVPARPEKSEFLDELLSGLGASFSYEEDPEAKRKRAQEALAEKGTQLLVVDELQDLETGSAKKQEALLDLIFGLSKTAGIPILMLGGKETRESLGVAVREQVEIEELSALEGEDYDAFLEGRERLLPLRSGESSRLTEEPLRGKLYAMTDGIAGAIDQTLIRASQRAIETGEERITPEILESVEMEQHR